MCIGSIECNGSVAPNIILIDASHNLLKSIAALWKTLCPLAWWVNASFNQITHLSSEAMPYALGSLNLADNGFPLHSLNALRFIHILRLCITGSNEIISIGSNPNIVTSSHRSETISLLPNIWVLDDDFITNSERNVCRRKSIPADKGSFNSVFFCDSINSLQSWPTIGPNTSCPDICQDWGTRAASEKEQSIIRLIQSIPLNGICGDYCRLDVLLEDYLEEIRVMNIFNRTILTNSNHSNSKSNSSSDSNRCKSNCSSINMLQLLSIPHKIRLDLSILMTASIFFPLPIQSYKDALIILLSPYLPLHDISCYFTLPSFVKTALVSIIRRICRKEIEELNNASIIFPKPSIKDFPYHSQEELGSQKDSSENTNIVTYMDIKGFNHLRPLKFYLNTPTAKHLEYYNSNSRNNLNHNINSKSSNSNIDSNLNYENVKNMHYAKFSELELEILTSLPDIPTKFMYPTKIEMNSNCWINLLASQTISLLSQVIGFPILSQNSNNKKNHDLFQDLKPLLELSKIHFNKQNLSESLITSNNNGLNHFSTKFGAGLPHGKISDLSWKKNIIENKINSPIKLNSKTVKCGKDYDKNEIMISKKEMISLTDFNDSTINIENIYFRKNSDPVVKYRKRYNEFPKNKLDNSIIKKEVEVEGSVDHIIGVTESESNQNNRKIDCTNISIKKKSTSSFNLNQSSNFIFNESVTDSGDEYSIYSITDEKNDSRGKSDYKKEKNIEPYWQQQQQQREMTIKIKKIELNGKEEENKHIKKSSLILPTINSPSRNKQEIKVDLKNGNRNENRNEVCSVEKNAGKEYQENLTLRNTIGEEIIQNLTIKNGETYFKHNNINNNDNNNIDDNKNSSNNNNYSRYKNTNTVTRSDESTDSLIFSITNFLPPSLPISFQTSAELKLKFSPSGRASDIPETKSNERSAIIVRKNVNYDQEDKADDKRADGNITPTTIEDVEEGVDFMD